MSEQIDAIVVGMGASGAIVAAELASAGAKVVGFDKGPAYDGDDVRFKHDEIKYYVRKEIVPHMGRDPITWRPDARSRATVLPWAVGPLAVDEPLHLPPSLGTGGGTVHWGGASWRLRAADFRMRTELVARWGRSALPEGTDVVDWPITYDELEPYFDRVEWEQGVSGRAGNVRGRSIEGGNPFESPRARDFPMPPLRNGAGDKRFVEAARRLGYHPFPQPAAIVTTDDFAEGRSGCTYCGFCHGYPCHVDAKTSTHVTSVPKGLMTGNLDLRPHHRVIEVLRSDDGRRVRGVRYIDPDGRRRELLADRVVLACYSLENTRLLLVSGVDGNGCTGKYFMTHNYGMFAGLMPEYTNSFMGPLTAASVIDDVNAELIPDNDLGVLWGSAITSHSGDIQPIEGMHAMPPHAPTWGAGMKEWARQNFRRMHAMYAQTASLPSEHATIDLDPHVEDPWGQPALRITHDWTDHDVASVEYHLRIKRRIGQEMGMTEFWNETPRPAWHLSTHEVGTHRMGEDPAASVVDRHGETHECAGLFAIGGGQFPTNPSYNPTTTIMALAYLTAEHIAQGATSWGPAPPS
ncbi:GMC family oxidoreductase [Conexibacter sp. CPCC 206217]|uniref:GMC family oxidoreductase n=1 Tax=Conexibacter sp. CPCC 206217 TaxID=3064574 RepID=UPI002717D98D|nr:GMC family oxidoreductase [Conexibacter sp. CPCC 206217]MDO8213546.1 GMC family oxidoreductase [Conexibacter sp. CPCC 206217]